MLVSCSCVLSTAVGHETNVAAPARCDLLFSRRGFAAGGVLIVVGVLIAGNVLIDGGVLAIVLDVDAVVIDCAAEQADKLNETRQSPSISFPSASRNFTKTTRGNFFNGR